MTTPTPAELEAMARSVQGFTDEELERELFAADPPGNDGHAIAWLEVLRKEEQRRKE